MGKCQKYIDDGCLEYAVCESCYYRFEELKQKEQKLKEIEGVVSESIVKLNKLIDHINSYGIYVREVEGWQVREIIEILENKNVN